MRPGPRLLHVGVCGKSADELLSEPRFPRTQEKGPDRQPEPPWAAAPKARLWRLNADRFRSAFKTWRAAGQAHGGCVSLGDLFHVQERNVICRPACWERLSAALRAGGGGGGGGLAGTCGGSGWRGRSPCRRADPRSLSRTFEWSNKGPASMPPSSPTTRGCNRPSPLARPAGTAEAGGLRVEPSRGVRGQETPSEDSQTQTQTHKQRNPVVTDQSQTRTEGEHEGERHASPSSEGKGGGASRYQLSRG